MTTITNGQLLAAFGSGASIIGLIWLIVTWSSARSKRLYIAHRRKVIFKARWVPHLEASVEINSRRSSDVVRDVVLLVNRTNEVVTDADFVRPLRMELSENAVVFDTRIAVGAGLEPAALTIDDDAVRIKKLVLEPRKGLIIEILHDGQSAALFKGVTKKHVGPSAYEPGRRFVPLIMLGGGLLGIISVFLYGAYVAPMLLNTWVDSVAILMIMAALLTPILAALFVLDRAPHLLPAERAFLRGTWA